MHLRVRYINVPRNTMPYAYGFDQQLGFVQGDLTPRRPFRHRGHSRVSEVWGGTVQQSIKLGAFGMRAATRADERAVAKSKSFCAPSSASGAAAVARSNSLEMPQPSPRVTDCEPPQRFDGI